MKLQFRGFKFHFVYTMNRLLRTLTYVTPLASVNEVFTNIAMGFFNFFTFLA